MKSVIKLKLWRLFLRALRAVTLTVDDWIQTQEVLLREPAYRRQHQAEVAPAASSRREKAAKVLRREGTTGWDVPAVNGARHSQRRKPVGAPRLRYQAGQFVRQGGAA